MFLPIKNHRVTLTGIILFSFTISACSTFGDKSDKAESAKVAEVKVPEKTPEQLKAEKLKAEEAARKKALADEDVIQLKPIKSTTSPEVEQLPETAPQAIAAPETTAPKLDIPTEPNTYLITVEDKRAEHPSYGVGDNRGFVLNGKQGGYVVAKRGDEITFKVRTGVQHDFYLTTNPKGWGAAVFSAGVDGQFTYEGDVKFKPGKDTPDTLFYGCRNHNSMGGKIVVVDPNADIASIKQKLDAERKAVRAKAQSAGGSSADKQKAKQKIAYVNMLIQFKGKSLDPAQIEQIKAKLAEAKAMEQKGDFSGALSTATIASDMFSQKAAQKGPSQEELAEAKTHFNDLLVTLESFIDSHNAMYKQTLKKNKDNAVDYDRDLVAKLVDDANKLAGANKFDPAGKQVKRAERLVTKALNDMYGSQRTVVYDLDFETPAEEYNYEVKRYLSYEELIPVAIEVKKPKQSSIKLMQTYLDKGRFFRKKADESAKAERWEEALVIIRDATIEVRRGLRLLGVSM